MAYTALGQPYNQVMNDYGIYGQNTMQGAPRPPDTGFSSYLSSGLKGAGEGAAASGGNPYVAAGMAALSLLNTSMGNDQADKAYEAQKQQYEDQLGLNREARLLQQKQQQEANAYTGANSAAAYQENIRNPYAAYFASIGK